MKIIIELVENGFYVIAVYPQSEGDNVVEKYVIDSEGDCQKYSREGITKLLNKVNDLVGSSYDSFSKENLNITWDKEGDEV